MSFVLRALAMSAFGLSLGLIKAGSPFAQISEYEDCSIGIDIGALGENLTESERIEILDQQFESGIADGDRCEVSDGGAAGSGGGAAGGGSDAASQGGGGGASSSSSAKTAAASPNALTGDQKSIAVSSDLAASSVPSISTEAASDQYEPGTNGKEHEALSSANNREALAQNILKRAQEEQDPTVKAALMERYKELSK